MYVEGEIRYDKYTGQDGVEKYFTDIVANEMQMLGGRSEGGGGGGGGQRSGGGDYQRGSGGDRQARPAPAQRREPASSAPASFDDVPFDDDIPF